MTRVACIDIGTVTCRLAVADVADGKVVALDKTSTICNLGEGIASAGRVSDAARDRVVACVGSYVRSAAAAGVAGVTCTLTSAARDAANADELLAALAGVGVKPQVIGGDVEGALTFAGVACDFAGEPILVADNGGGSTELAAGERTAAGDVRLGFVESVDVGCRRVSEMFLGGAGAGDTDEQVGAARAFARGVLTGAARRALAAVPGVTTLVTCGGTVTTLVAVREGLVPYDAARVHGATLTLADVEALLAKLAAMPLEARAAVAGLQPQRADVIVGGAAIVAELILATGFDTLVVSEHDLLFGLAAAAAAAIEGGEGAGGVGDWTPLIARV